MLRDINNGGQSGAKIEALGPLVLKRGNDRVGRQGRWLREFSGTECLPHVYASGRQWYVMERLEPYDVLPDVSEVVAELRKLWSVTRFTPLNCTAEYHNQYIARKTRAVQELVPNFTLPLDFQKAQYAVTCNWGKLPHTVAHGDCAAGNVMRRGEQLVIIDPGSSYIVGDVFPDTPALDVGKLLYSGLGYERLRFDNRGVHWLYNDVLEVAAAELSSFELFAAQYFCSMHFFTSIPYTPPEHRPMMIDRMHEALGVIWCR